jgi:hypothetical protein
MHLRCELLLQFRRDHSVLVRDNIEGRLLLPFDRGDLIYFIAVLDCTTGSSTALAPDEPCSIDTVAF